jgi:formylmethanofuran dehydrogenase subunit C
VRTLTLRPKIPIEVPLEAEALTPERLAGLSAAQVAALPLAWGRRARLLGEILSVEVEEEGPSSGEEREGEPPRLTLEGDFSRVKKIGKNMTRGVLEIRGDAGMHLGSGMSGGEIRVRGNADAWAGAMMSGGLLEIGGDAGPYLAGAYPGETRGMRGGTLLVRGNAANRAGEGMRRGLIAVAGRTGDFPCARFVAGTMVVFGILGDRAGAGSKRGTLAALGGLEGEILPTYQEACLYRPLFLLPVLRFLKERGFPVRPEHQSGLYRRWTGDVNTLGKGEILVHEEP